ncbi:binding-protein-dependent transport system inner membrane protein [Lysobacter bugurensis]|uniref:Binding-protein-dependent transport system inner membrane protein n=1 Tax=Cognatilysobacter bugurensis TaxID=543356 RepID=A0A918T2E4_9GAMM|nr:binding-protein-dependent transport system inner membrane protein [Lysobacter bugurensis]
MPATADPAPGLTRFTVPGPGRAPWLWLAVALSLPSLVPLLSAFAALARPDPATLDHLLTHVLPLVGRNTAWLLLGVGVASAALGTVLAALVALCDFPGRRVFAWLLVLPLVFPGYVLATVFIELFDYAGPVGTLLRELGAPELPFRSRAGLIAVLTCALYPYVYLVAREAFASQGSRALEVARSLGMSPLRAFVSTSLPLARPWVAGGTLLVLMETLADFGTVAAFNYDTFTTAIYKAWFALFSPDTALQIAAVMLVFVIALVVIEAALRRRQSFATVGHVESTRLRLGRYAWLASGLCALVVTIAFAVPAARLLWNAVRHLAELDARYVESVTNALGLATVAAALTAAAAFVIAMAARNRPGLASTAVTRLATLGYGLPGALLAVGLYVPVARFSTWLANETGMDAMWQGGLALLLVGYGIRFLAVAHAPVAGGLLRIRPGLVDASRSLGVTGPRQLRHVQWPLLRGSFAAAGLLVFVDVMKEMPITLMMRPFGWDTLATRVFELTNEGEWARAALPSLAIVLAGLVPVMLLTRRRQDAP